LPTTAMKKWVVVGYFKDGRRTELPLQFDNREQAEEIARITRHLAAPSMVMVVEEVDDAVR
jgi:hypothetical protein